MQIEDMSREEILSYLDPTADEVLDHLSRGTLMSALGFDRPNDFLDEVNLGDVMAYFDESDIVERINLESYWDSDDAYNRYGSDLMDHFDVYDYIPDDYVYDTIRETWGASEVREAYGDDEALLDHLLDIVSVKDTVNILEDNGGILHELAKRELIVKLKVNFRDDALTKLLKAQREVLVDAVRDLH